MLIGKHVQSGYAGEEELKTAHSLSRGKWWWQETDTVFRKTKQTNSSVLLAKKIMLALASQEGVEQTHRGKPMQTKMNNDRQGPHVTGNTLNKCNIITMRSKHAKGGKTVSHLSNGAKNTDMLITENTVENWKSHSGSCYFFNPSTSLQLFQVLNWWLNWQHIYRTGMGDMHWNPWHDNSLPSLRLRTMQTLSINFHQPSLWVLPSWTEPELVQDMLRCASQHKTWALAVLSLLLTLQKDNLHKEQFTRPSENYHLSFDLCLCNKKN